MSNNKSQESLPKIALDFIDSVVKKVRYRKNIRQEVHDEEAPCQKQSEEHNIDVRVDRIVRVCSFHVGSI